jgi:hypothetical protein
MADRQRVDCAIHPSLETVMSLPCVMECEVFNAVHLMGGVRTLHLTESHRKRFCPFSLHPSLTMDNNPAELFIFYAARCSIFSSGNRVFSFLSGLLWNLFYFLTAFFSFYFHAFKPCLCLEFLFCFCFCPIFVM